MATITVNGKTYDRVDDMPPEVRQAYDQAMGLLADKNQNGIPDIAEGLLPGAKPTVTTRFKITTKKKIVYKGQTYESPDDLPAEARQAYLRAMGTLGPHPDGLPDAPESGQAAALPSPASIVATPPMISAVPSQLDDADRPRQLVVAGALIVLLLLVSGLVAGLLYMWLFMGAR